MEVTVGSRGMANAVANGRASEGRYSRGAVATAFKS